MGHDRIRARALIIAGVSAALALVVATAWVWSSREHAPAAPALHGLATTRPDADELTAPRIVKGAMFSTSVDLVSDVGLPIENAYVDGADERWQPVPVHAGRVDRDQLAHHTRICVRGHRARPIDAAASTLVFAVDALLVVRCPGLKRCVEAAAPLWEHGGGEAQCAGFLDDDRLGLAVACALLSQDRPGRDVVFELQWHDRLKSTIRFVPRAGLVAEWSPSCPEPPRTNVLTLKITRREVDPAVGFHVRACVEPQAEAIPALATSLRPSPDEVAFPWGGVTTSRSAYEMTAEVVSGTDEVLLGGVLDGARVCVVLQDRESRAFGSTTVTNDGSPHWIEVRPPFHARATLTAKDGGPGPSRVDIAWRQSRTGADGPAWITRAGSWGLRSPGALDVIGPDEIRCDAAASSAMPTWAEVRIDAPGFRISTREERAQDADFVDFGAWELEPLPADCRVRPLVDARTCGLANGCEIAVQNGAGEIETLRVARVWPVAGGLVALRFQRPGSPDVEPPIDPLTLRVQRAVRLLASSRWGELRGYTLAIDGAFHEEAGEEHDLDITLAPDSGKLRTRVTWFGIGDDTQLLRAVKDKVYHQHWTLPAGRLAFEWRGTQSGAQWISRPITAQNQRFENLNAQLENAR